MAQTNYIEKTKYGDVLVLTHEWRPEVKDYIIKNNIKGLYLNDAKGWRGDNLNFLHELKQLLVFRIIDFRKKDSSAINTLHNLRSLQISTYEKYEIDFSNFPKLEDCGIHWHNKLKNLYECKTIKDLYLYGYSEGHDTENLSKLHNLETLRISIAPIRDLTGLSKLKKLKQLCIYYFSKLESLKGIGDILSLEHLEIRNCNKINKIDELATLVNLKHLELSDNKDIETLAPIRNLKKIEVCYFSGSTKIVDGDLSPIRKLPKLKKVVFTDRKSYNYCRFDFKSKKELEQKIKEVEKKCINASEFMAKDLQRYIRKIRKHLEEREKT